MLVSSVRSSAYNVRVPNMKVVALVIFHIFRVCALLQKLLYNILACQTLSTGHTIHMYEYQT